MASSHRSRTPSRGKAIRQQAGSAARSSGHQEEMPSPCLGLCTQEQAAGPTRVPDDVVQHHQPLELQQQLPVGVLGERLGLKASQPVVGVLVAFHKELEGAHLRRGEAALWRGMEAGGAATGACRTREPYLGRQPDAVEALPHFGHLLQGQPLSSGLHPVDGTVVKGLAGQIHHLGGQEHRGQQGQLAVVTSSLTKQNAVFCRLCPARGSPRLEQEQSWSRAQQGHATGHKQSWAAR